MPELGTQINIFANLRCTHTHVSRPPPGPGHWGLGLPKLFPLPVAQHPCGSSSRPYLRHPGLGACGVNWVGRHARSAGGGSSIRVARTTSASHAGPGGTRACFATVAGRSLSRAGCSTVSCVAGGTGAIAMTARFARTACALWLAACGWRSLPCLSPYAPASCIGNYILTKTACCGTHPLMTYPIGCENNRCAPLPF